MTSMSSSTFSSTDQNDNNEEHQPNKGKIMETLWKISSRETDKKTMQAALENLNMISVPQETLELVASHLFTVGSNQEDSDNNNHSDGNDACDQNMNSDGSDAVAMETEPLNKSRVTMDSKQALHTITTLVTHRPQTYLLQASKSVRQRAESLVGHSCTPPLQICVSQDELQVIASQLSSSQIDDEQVQVQVSNHASHTLIALCQAYPPSCAPSISIVTDLWKKAKQEQLRNRTQSSTIAVRCASTIVNLVCYGGDEAMQSATNSHAIQAFMDMVADASDPLMQMSALELVETLATKMPMHELRARWLYSQHLTEILINMAGGGGAGEYDDDPDPLLGGPALRLLSCILHLAPRYANAYGLLTTSSPQAQHPMLVGFQRALSKFVQTSSSDEMGRLAYIDAVSSYASSSPQALQAILTNRELKEGWMDLSTVATPKLKRVVMNSISQVMLPPKHNEETNTEASTNANADTSLSEQRAKSAMALYEALGQTNQHAHNTTEMLLSHTRSPLLEIRLGAYEVMAAVARANPLAGPRQLLSHPDFYPFLTSEEGNYEERSKEGKEAKYEILVAVLESGVKNLLADEVVKTLEERRRRGPHFVQTVGWEMATE